MNYNPDDKNPEPTKPETWIEPELEARVVAWVAGEASAFEVAELERLCAEKPELAIFKRRIEAVHGLVAEATRPDATPLMMSEQRRAKVLATLRVADERGGGEPPKTVSVLEPSAQSRRRKLWPRRWMLAAAACIPIGGLIVVLSQRAYHKPARPDPAMTVVQGVKSDDKVELSPFMVEKPSGLRRVVAETKARLGGNRETAEDKTTITLNLPAPESAPLLNAPPPEPPAAIAIDASNLRGADALRQAEPVVPQQRPIDEAQPTAGARFNYSITAAGGSIAQAGRSISDERAAPPVGTPPPPNAVPAPDNTTPFTASSIDDRNAGSVVAEKSISANVAGANVLESQGVPSKLDAFVVSETREGNATALSSNAAAPTPSTALAMGGAAPGMEVHGPAPGGPTRVFSDAPSAATNNEAIKLDAFTVSSDTSARAAPIGRAGIRPNLGKTTGGAGGQTGQQAGGQAAEKQSTAVIGGFGGAAVGTVTGSITLEAAKNVSPQPRELDAPVQRPKLEQSAPSIEETSTARESVSTFSLHVSDASFRLAQSALARGQAPDPARIRPEEFYNAFDYGDPAPAVGEKIFCRIDQAAHPFLQQRNMVRVAMKVAATGRNAATPLRLTVLLDTSGSMEREDRAAAVRRAMQVLVSLLGPNDRITLIGFARQPRLLAENLPGNNAGQVLDLMARTPAEGGTNLEEALELAGDIARRHRLAGAQNRIVLLTDGAANLGNANPAQLASAIETLRQQGIAFDACGVGTEGVDDEILERLTRNGDGRYYVLNTPQAAEAGFARQLAGAFRPAAENVKVQVRFNPARVARYRLIGFEQHRLREQDFRNDKVDAAELAAGEAAVALYQIEPLLQGEGELGEVSVRFRDPATGEMVERKWTLAYDSRAPAFDRATPRLQLAGTAALLAEKLRESPLADQFTLRDLAPIVNTLREHYANQPRVQELATMFAQMRRISGE